MTSPYLLRPVRRLEEALRDIEAAKAAQEALRKDDNRPSEQESEPEKYEPKENKGFL